MKIAFVCKHNVFRSRVAEEYLKRISNHEVSSFGLFKSKKIPPSEIIPAGKKFGLDLSLNSKTASIEDLRKLDLLIIVADDVPSKIFEHHLYKLKNKIVRWDIPDLDAGSPREESIKNIIAHVDSFVKNLDKNGKTQQI